MTADEVKALKPKDRVRCTGDQMDGVVAKVDERSATVRWSDGAYTVLFFDRPAELLRKI